MRSHRNPCPRHIIITFGSHFRFISRSVSGRREVYHTGLFPTAADCSTTDPVHRRRIDIDIFSLREINTYTVYAA